MQNIIIVKFLSKIFKAKPFLGGSRAFTLVETLVAISILSLVTTATLTAVQSALKDASMTKDKIAAFYLAQEGMEFIKNIRDENTLQILNGSSIDWLAGMSGAAGDPCFFGKVCRIDSPAKTITYCGMTLNSCPNLNQNSISKVYSYTTGAGWTTSNFKREIQFQLVTPDEVIVLMTVSWTNRGVTQSFQVTESFFKR
jgi:prepilin-type N-terminal cleavage/methylation domain-containing protein